VNVVNATPHEIAVVLDHGTVVLPPSGICPRVRIDAVPDGTVVVAGHEVPVVRATPGPVEGLPPAEPGTVYAVSRLVLDAARDRDDLVVPDEIVRDEAGRVVGCRRFAR